MGKWNKAPPEVSEEFLQNEERRKQMIIEAARRRKQKQRKLQQQAQQQKKQQQEALTRHKQQKKDAYVKYLRNNMHDKYEEMKRNQKINQPEIRSKSKWKKDTVDSQSQVKSEYNLQGLDLQVNIERRNNLATNKISNKVGGQVVRNQISSRNFKKQKIEPMWQKQTVQDNKKVSQKRRMLQDEFQNMWKQEHQDQQKQIDYELSVQETVFEDMMGSKLLDSLDLDLDTVTRGKNLDKKLKKQSKQSQINKNNKDIDEIKNMIGYQSVLMSIDQRSQMIKKYNQFMKNQVQPTNPIKIQEENNKNIQPQNKITRITKTSKPISTQKIQKPLNEGELFNQLKNKKQGKILNWAKDQAQQAQDLFSNCSTNKKSRVRGSQLLKQINKEIQQKSKKQDIRPVGIQQSGSSQQINMKKKQRPLDTIPQKKINSSLQRLRQRSYEKKVSSGTNLPLDSDKKQNQTPKNRFSRQKVVEVNKPRSNRLNSAQNRNFQPPQPPRNASRQRANKTATNSFKQNSNISQNVHYPNQRNRTDSRRSLSKEKENTWSTKNINTNMGNNSYSRAISKTSSQVLPSRQPPMPQNAPNQSKRLPHLPPTFQKPIPNVDAITIATQQQAFQVQSFIKNELVSLNRQERQLQQQLRNIHVENKQKIKEIQKKYDIKTDYKHSHQLRQKQDGEVDQQYENQSLNSYQHAHKKQTEDQLEESIQRLDDMLLRREIVNKQKQSRITEQDNESESTHRSLINPMSDPISLHKQVLQLAENLSRFQGEPQDITTGYGAKLRMKKKSVQKQVSKPEMKKVDSQQRKQTDVDMSQSQDINYSQLNLTNQRSKISKVSKVTKPPSLQYEQYNCNIPTGYGESGILDDQLQDSIQKGKIEVNQRLRRMLLD